MHIPTGFIGIHSYGDNRVTDFMIEFFQQKYKQLLLIYLTISKEKEDQFQVRILHDLPHTFPRY